MLQTSRTAAPVTDDAGFRAACQLALDYLNASMPLTFWSVTRVENGRQTHLYVDPNDFGLTVGDSTPWEATFCVHMVAGTAPRIAWDVSRVPVLARSPMARTTEIGAYAGAPILEGDGSLFGAICGVDRVPREDLAEFGPTLNVLAQLLTLALQSDRALTRATYDSHTALTYATTDALTGIHNRRAWDATLAQIEHDFGTYADPTVVVVVDLDNLKHVNDGPGGHRAGDQVLRGAAEVLSRTVRAHDFVARIGGDEFGIVLTNCEATLAPELLERLGDELDRAGIPASVGWSALQPNSDVRHAIDLADRAMYDAKRSKRRPVASRARATADTFG